MGASTNPIINAIARGRAEALDELKFKEEMETEKERRKAQQLVFQKTEQELDRQLKQDQRLLDVQKFQIREALRNSLAGGGNTVDMGEFGKVDFQPQEPQMLPNAQGSELTPGMKMPQIIAPLQQVASPLGGMETFSGEEILATSRATNAATAKALDFEQQKAFIKQAPILEQAQIIEEVRQQGRKIIADDRLRGMEDIANIRENGALTRAEIQAKATKDAARIRGGFTLAAAKMRQSAGGDSSLKDGIVQLAEDAGFGRKDLGSTKIDTEARGILGGKKWVNVLKKQREQVGGMVSVIGALQRMEDFVTNAKFPKTRGEAVLKGITEYSKASVNLSELQKMKDEFMALAPKFAETFGEVGRKTEGDIQRTVGALPTDFTITEGDALRRIHVLKESFNNTFNGILVGVPKDQKQALIQDILANDFDVFSGESLGKSEAAIPGTEESGGPTKQQIEQFMLQTGADRETAIKYLSE